MTADYIQTIADLNGEIAMLQVANNRLALENKKLKKEILEKEIQELKP